MPAPLVVETRVHAIPHSILHTLPSRTSLSQFNDINTVFKE